VVDIDPEPYHQNPRHSHKIPGKTARKNRMLPQFFQNRPLMSSRESER
jgi:hypothetical protein